jgi:heat shock protein HtpX
LAPAELEGVLAHELGRVRHRDVIVETPAVLVAGWLVEASRIGGWLERALLFVLAPVAASIEQVLLSPKRVFAADVLAARVCESPHSLADALVRLEQGQELVSFRASPTTEPIYTVNPFDAAGLAAMFQTHPPIGERVRRLRDLDPEWREKLRAA